LEEKTEGRVRNWHCLFCEFQIEINTIFIYKDYLVVGETFKLGF